MNEPIQVTHLHCPASGAAPGDDNSTHHLVPRSNVMVCAHCKRSEQDLRLAAERTQP